MDDNTKIWKEIEAITEEYRALRLDEAIDYNKFYLYSIITHSTAIEGSTLTESETALLFDEGLTANGKPLLHHLMNKDLKDAYLYAISEANKKSPITPKFLQALNAKVMAQTGGCHESMAGSFDSAKGEFRKVAVFARGGASYMDYKKVPGAVEDFCLELKQRLTEASSPQERYCLSFDAHLNLVTIHPWADGNGRTSRLIMNYIQFYYNIIPSKVFQQDRAEYIEALKQSQINEDNNPFRIFMAKQHLTSLKKEITDYLKSQQGSKEFKFLF